MIDQRDPAKRRIAFIGFPENAAVKERISNIDKVMKDMFPEVRFTTIDNFYSGPYNDRKPNQAAYVEFSSAEAAKHFDIIIKNKHSSKLTVGGVEIKVKPARTKVGQQRNWSLRKASELIKNHTESNGKEVTIDWKERQVTVNALVSFTQRKGDTKGTFVEPYLDLALP